MAILLPSPLACCRWELERRHMTPPFNFALRIIVEEDPKLVRRLNGSYADAAPDGGLESAERDMLLDVLSRHFTGQLLATLRWHGNYPAVPGRPPACNDRGRLEGQFLRRDRIASSAARHAIYWF